MRCTVERGSPERSAIWAGVMSAVDSSLVCSVPAHCTANGKALLAALPAPELEATLPERLPRLTKRTIANRPAKPPGKFSPETIVTGDVLCAGTCTTAPVPGAALSNRVAAEQGGHVAQDDLAAAVRGGDHGEPERYVHGGRQIVGEDLRPRRRAAEISVHAGNAGAPAAAMSRPWSTTAYS